MKGLDGVLKCIEHDESFNTPSEFYEHERIKLHSHTGETLCIDCFGSGIKKKAETDPTDFALGRPTPRCKECQEKLEAQVIAKLKEKEKNKK